MLLLELLSRLHNSDTSLLFWDLFTGLNFLGFLGARKKCDWLIDDPWKSQTGEFGIGPNRPMLYERAIIIIIIINFAY